jgi:NAD(P)-dependent dehydrogenase (short-subunit alcohol dehydrogenase family)
MSSSGGCRGAAIVTDQQSPKPLLTALVTGGAQRIGRAITERLAAAGYAVAIHYNSSREAAEALAATLRARGGHAAPVRADLTDPDAAAALLPAAQAALGPIGLVVNNVGVFESDSLMTLDRAGLHRQFSANVLAPSLIVQAFARQLPAAARGSVVNIVDHRVWKLTPQHYSYTLSKAALWAATQTMAQALAPRIRVNAVGPGPVLPNPADGPDGLLREVAGVPLLRQVSPADIAEAVAYLAAAASVTGQMIAVDAGQHIGWRTPDIVE